MSSESRPSTSAAAAVRAAGGQTALARELGIAQSTVATWIRRGNELPAKFVIPVERAFGVSRHDLRPDLYPREEETSPLREPAQHPAAHPSASDATPQPADADGPPPALDYPGSDPLEGVAA